MAAPQANIAIPAQFLNNLQSISFSHDCNNLVVTVQPLTIPSFSNLQIVRLSPGCPNSIYFSPDFLEFITQRFFSRGAAQLQTIRDSAGRILEVLAFSSRAQLQNDTPDLVLPLPFEFDDFQFLLTHLEPLFTPKKKTPCPDLTIIGRGNGVLGLAGNRSVHIHCVWAVLYFLSKTSHWKRVVLLVENAGSMKPHMKQYIHDLLGIPDKCAHYLNCAHWGPVSRAGYFFTSSTIKVIPQPTSSPFDDGWSPALIISPDKQNHLQPRPLPPWLRPRLVTGKGSVVQSPLAYHPNNLLYDVNFFVSRSNFVKV